MNKRIHSAVCMALLSSAAPPISLAQTGDNAPSAATELPKLVEWDDTKFRSRIEAIDLTWAGHRARADILMTEDNQLIGYYDANRQLTIAYRKGLGNPWNYHKLPSWLGWDSHNSVALGVDEAGYIHVMANMHADPIVYFQSEKPWNVRSIVQHKGLVNDAYEERVTYPHFMNDRQGRLIAKFRSGGSGNGIELYHRFDTKTKSWSRMHGGGPLVDGEGERNGYFKGPDLGPDGYYHLTWVWRETPSANTNHDLSYARSKDLDNWETSDGKPLTLPMTLSTSEIIEPVPVGGGILNGQHRLGFDSDKKPMISYYKYDQKGDTQIYLLRKTAQGWKSDQISNWTGSRQELDRQGSLANTVSVSADPEIAADGSITVQAIRDGVITQWQVNAKTNKVMAVTTISDPLPAQILSEKAKREMPFHFAKATGKGTGVFADYDWYLTWHALPANQDVARDDIPSPSVLRLIPVPKK
ncbi:MAG: hypothetical protein HC843_07530 [Sphingomonadales bacterium]|nr:hypothetical protein [Sphingomonadales bacterium]